MLPPNSLPIAYEVLEHAGGLGMALALVGTNIIALMVLWCVRKRSKIWGVLLLCALLWGVQSQFLLIAGKAGAEYWAGTAHMEVLSPGNPDPSTRIEQDWRLEDGSCSEARWSDWNNMFLFIITRLFGASPNDYSGPYPTGDEALGLIRARGEMPSPDSDGSAFIISGVRFPVRAVDLDDYLLWKSMMGDDEPHDPFARHGELSALDLQAQQMPKMVLLAEDAVLLDTGTEVQLRVWERWHHGRVWAHWPVTAASDL